MDSNNKVDYSFSRFSYRTGGWDSALGSSNYLSPTNSSPMSMQEDASIPNQENPWPRYIRDNFCNNYAVPQQN